MADISEEAYAEARSLYQQLLTPGDEACDANVPADIEVLARALMAKNARIRELESLLSSYKGLMASAVAELSDSNKRLSETIDIAKKAYGLK